MIFGILLLAVIISAYWLLVEGWLWRIILSVAGWFGIWIGLQYYYPQSKEICLHFSSYSFSWAAIIPTIIIILAMAYTKD